MTATNASSSHYLDENDYDEQSPNYSHLPTVSDPQQSTPRTSAPITYHKPTSYLKPFLTPSYGETPPGYMQRANGLSLTDNEGDAWGAVAAGYWHR